MNLKFTAKSQGYIHDKTVHASYNIRQNIDKQTINKTQRSVTTFHTETKN